MQINSPKLGVIDFTDKEIIRFEDGLYGFENLREYIIIHGGEESLFSYLQSIEEPSITFVIANPREIVKGYELTISKSDYDSLDIKDKEMLADFVIVTIPENIEEISANLLGPVIINCATNQGKQVISLNTEYTTKHKILDELQKKAS